ncbi:addiction module toxin RelE [Candidatus Woesearchaeota archaeon]|nr:addiction module toxin RelE [Candidatus Woesearchaeota archaeon]
MFEFDISCEIKILIRKLLKKDKKRVEILNKKIKEIINNNAETIDRYHNCSYDLKEYKHVHIDKSFVLLFKVYKGKNMIYFWKLKHHDNLFKK